MLEDSFSRRLQLNRQDPVATSIVARIYELFAVDAEARRNPLCVAARLVQRQERVRPLLDQIRGRVHSSETH